MKYLEELLNQITNESNDAELLRQAIIAESDAVSLYVQMAKNANDNRVKALLLDLAQEERVHISELTLFLEKYQKLQRKARKEAFKELEDKNWFK